MTGNKKNKPHFEALEPRLLMSTTVSLQKGALGYSTMEDTHIREDFPDIAYGNVTPGLVDGDDSSVVGAQQIQSLLRFDSLFGTGPNQIPAGAVITSATLTLVTMTGSTDDTSNVASLYRMLVGFTESTTWNDLGNGVTIGSETSTTADDSKIPSLQGAATTFDVTASVQAWANNPETNFGWLLVVDGDNMWRWVTSESSNVARRPMLSVTFEAGPAVNQPPAVNAGIDQTVAWPAAANLTGNVSDDGVSGSLATIWSVVSGPGSVTFANASNASTTATFSQAGEYVLRLTADDGEFSVQDDLTITVQPLPESIQTKAFQDGVGGYAGTLDTYIRQDSVNAAFGAATLNLVDADDNTASGAQAVQSLIRFGSIFGAAATQVPVGSVITSATLTIYTGTGSTDGTTNTASLYRMLTAFSESSSWNGLVDGVNVGVDTLSTPDASKVPAASGSATSFDVTAALQAWANDPSANLGWLLTSNGDNLWRWVTSEHATVAMRPMLSISYAPGAVVNQPPEVNAGTDQNVEFPGAATLDGTVNDDGLSGPVVNGWSVISGPGAVTFGDSSSVDTTGSFSKVGQYVLRLTSSDGQFTRSDDVTINVQYAPSSIITKTVQEGLNGYVGTQDTYIRQDTPTTSFGGSVLNLTDSDDSGATGVQPVQALIRFDNMFGFGQIPVGSSIVSATLVLTTGTSTGDSSTDTASLYRMKTSWWENSTWDSLFNGVQNDGSDAFATADGAAQPKSGGAGISIDVTGSLQAWADDPAGNFGWLVMLSGDNMWRWISSEGANNALRPKLVINYVPNPTPPNQAPVVSAGPDQTITLPASASLDGTVLDDNLPQQESLQVLWSLQSGPGTVTFGNAATIDTTASFSSAGTYVLKLTASDGSLSSEDLVTITVEPQVTNHTRTFREGTNGYFGTQDTYVRTDNATTQFGGSTAAIVDAVDGSGSSQALIRFDGLFGSDISQIPAGATITSATLTIYTGSITGDPSTDIVRLYRMLGGWSETSTWASLVNGVSANGVEAMATADASATPSVLGGAVTFNVTAALQAWLSDPSQNFGWALIQTGGGNAWRFNTSEADSVTLRPALSINYSIVGTPVTNQAPQVSAGPDQTVTLPSAANLNGTVVDDELPDPPATVTTTWSLLNGPGTATFGDANAIDTTVTFSVAGTYTLRLTAFDGELTTSDDMTLTALASPIQVLDPVPAGDGTGEKPQSKVWEYAGKWWSVFPDTTGNFLWRLDGTTWVRQFRLDYRAEGEADTLQVGNVTHVLTFDGDNNTRLNSLEYDASLGTYKRWTQRPSTVYIPLTDQGETATIAMDGNGRLWLATDQATSIELRYSDGDYSAWSDPIILASGITDDDISDIMTLADGSVAVIWSNQVTRVWGFRTHAPGADPTDWTADEMPGAADGQDVGFGLADDHISTVVGSDGTVYVAVKTSYDTAGMPVIALLVRRPNGQWDPLYTVDTDRNATRPNVVLNEAAGIVMVSYSVIPTASYGDIMYRTAPLSNLASWSPRQTLLAGGYNNVSSTRQLVDDDVVFLMNDVNEFFHGVHFTWPAAAPMANVTLSLASTLQSETQEVVTTESTVTPIIVNNVLDRRLAPGIDSKTSWFLSAKFSHGPQIQDDDDDRQLLSIL